MQNVPGDCWHEFVMFALFVVPFDLKHIAQEI